MVFGNTTTPNLGPPAHYAVNINAVHTLNVALTGATGYIASHIAVALAEHGHWVVGLDNFVNSSPLVLDRLATISDTGMPFEELDLSQTDRGRFVSLDQQGRRCHPSRRAQVGGRFCR